MNNHENKKKTLKVLGAIILVIGLIFTIIGFASFFSSFGHGFPRYFWCSFVGLPFLGIGSGMLGIGYKREAMKYMKDESMPVYKEAYYDIKPEINDAINSFKNQNDKICPICKTSNDEDAKYCKKCGTSLMDKYCEYCNSKLDSDATYCSNCGRRLEK